MPENQIEIRVTGKGEVEFEPDLCRIILDFSHSRRSTSAAIRDLNEAVTRVKELLSQEPAAGVLSEQDLSVDEHWNADPADPKTLVQVAKRTIDYSIAWSGTEVDGILARLGSLKSAPYIKIEYSISDASRQQTVVRREAVANAKAAAQEIADELGLEISGQKSVHYELPDGCSKKAFKQAIGIPVSNVSSRGDRVKVTDSVNIVFLATKARTPEPSAID